MKNQFVTYEIALKLKELGFDEECFGYWRNEDFTFPLTIGKITTKFDFDDNINYHNFKCLAPLWQQVIDWFREKYKLYINIEPDITKNWQFSISNLNDGLLFGSKSLFIQKGLNYEEIREQAILKVIEICQKKQ